MKLNLNNISSFEPSSVTTINANNDAIETALENTFSRDGTSPNEMNDDVDMNSYRLYNLPAPGNDTEPLRRQDMPEFDATGAQDGYIWVYDADLETWIVSPNNTTTTTTVDSTESSFVDNVSDLRDTLGSSGNQKYLLNHTSRGDLGGGWFYYITGASPGTYTDDNGTVILPTGGNGSSAWLRVWDGQNSHVGWWGAKCDLTTDDITPFKQALALYTNGRYSLRAGSLNLGRGCAVSEPIYIGGNSNYSFKLKGEGASSRGVTTDSCLKYTGSATRTFILAYGLNQSPIKDLNISPSNNVTNAIHFVSDNQTNTTLSGSVTAGSAQTATVGSATGITLGSALGIGIGSTFEVIYIRGISGTTITADFRYNHSAGEAVGGGGSPNSSSSGARMDECTIQSPDGFATTLSGGISSGSDVTITPASMTNIATGQSLYIDSKRNGEIIKVKTVGGSTFTADVVLSHSSGVQICLATSCILIGELISSGSPQVSEMFLEKVHLLGSTNAYSGIRLISSGNVKNFRFSELHYGGAFKIPVALEAGSGSITIDHMIGAGATDTLILQNGGTLVVNGLEDESSGAIPLRGGSGKNALSVTFLGPHFQGALDTDDIFCYYQGALTILGGNVFNPRTGSTFPKFLLPNITDPTYPTGLTLIGVWLQNVDSSSAWLLNNVGGVDYLHSATPSVVESLRVAVVDCYGGNSGAMAKIENFPAKAVVSSRTVLKTKPPGNYFLIENATYKHGGRYGWFNWDASISSGTYTADTNEGVYVSPTGSGSGSFVRTGWKNGLRPSQFGAVIDGLNASGTDDYTAALAWAAFCFANGCDAIFNSGNMLTSDTIKFGASIHDSTALGKIIARIDKIGDLSGIVNSSNVTANRVQPGCNIQCDTKAAVIPTFTSGGTKSVIEYNHYPHAAQNTMTGPLYIATRAYLDANGQVNSDTPGLTSPPSNGLIGFVNAYVGFKSGRSIYCYGMEKAGVLLTLAYNENWEDIQGYNCGDVLHVVDGNGSTFNWLGYYGTRGFVADGDTFKVRSGSEQLEGDIVVFSGDHPVIDGGYLEDVSAGVGYTGCASLQLGVVRYALTVGSSTGFVALQTVNWGGGKTGQVYLVPDGTHVTVTCDEGVTVPAPADNLTNGTNTSAISAATRTNTIYYATVLNLRMYRSRPSKKAFKLRGAVAKFISSRIGSGVASDMSTDVTSAAIFDDCTDFPEDTTNFPWNKYPRIDWSGFKFAFPSYTVAGVPAVGVGAGCMIYVTNEAGGAVPAFSDGTNWRRVTDRAVVS